MIDDAICFGEDAIDKFLNDAVKESEHCSKVTETKFNNYCLIRFAQTKITLLVFFNNWVSKGKRKFSASIPVFLCNMLRGNKVTIFLL